MNLRNGLPESLRWESTVEMKSEGKVPLRAFGNELEMK